MKTVIPFPARWTRSVAILCLAVLPVAAPLAAQTESVPQPAWHLVWNPATDLYEPYAADPRRSRHIVSLVNVLDSDLPDSQNLRWGLSIGGTYGIARLVPHGNVDRAWQVEVEARFYAQFDIHYALDEIGHDGRVGGILIKSLNRDVAARLTFIHTSNHIGDEYLLRNHITERLPSRREEAGAGVSWKISENLRTYGEAGYGLNLGPRNRPIRLQTGLEFTDRPRFGSSRLYAALDATSFEENDYDISANLQAGILLQSAGSHRKYRIGFELYDGRAQLDSFFLNHERYATFGFWLDL